MVDSHCHLYYFDNFKEIIEAAEKSGVTKFLNLMELCDEKLDLHFNNFVDIENIYLAIGVHPVMCENFCIETLEEKMKKYMNKIVAIGETGLDLHYAKNYTEQMDCFVAHLDLCKKYKKPVVIHTREISQEQMVEVLNKLNEFNVKAQFHCFTFDKSYAEIIIDKAHYISISGIITFKNAEYLEEVVRYCPLELLLVETDSPYLAPVPYRGKKNQPIYIKEIYEKMAKIKNIELENFVKIIECNFYSFINN